MKCELIHCKSSEKTAVTKIKVRHSRKSISFFIARICQECTQVLNLKEGDFLPEFAFVEKTLKNHYREYTLEQK